VRSTRKTEKATEKLIVLLNQDSFDAKEILESIKSGRDANAKNKDNQTVLYLAAKNGYTFMQKNTSKRKRK
jgi:ankyrin repeat protein